MPSLIIPNSAFPLPHSMLPGQALSFHSPSFDSIIHPELPSGKKEHNHMGQFGKGYGYQHDLAADNVGHEPELVVRDLVNGKKTGHKRGNGNSKK